MKNVRKEQLKKCIYVTADEYEEIIKNIFGDEAAVEFASDGINIHTDNDDVTFDELSRGLAEYFEVSEVISVHMDNCEIAGVWICYESA